MINEPAHVQFVHKTLDVKQSPVDPTQLLLMIILTATTGLSTGEVDAIKDRVVKDGIKVYISGTVDTEMLMAMRLALLRAEQERDQNRTRADHFESELHKATARISTLETELGKKRKTLELLEEGLRG